MELLIQVLGGCLSGSEELISKIRQYHHVIGGVLNPVSKHVRWWAYNIT